MRTRPLMAGTALAAVGLLAASAGAAQASTSTSHALFSCTGVVQITHLGFTPSSVSPGSTPAADLNLRNCTGVSQSTTATWFGRFIGSSAGIPPGCPALDPLPQPATLAPHGKFHSSVGYQVPVSCTASQLQVTVRIQQGGTVLAQETADLAIIQDSRTNS